MGLIVFNTTLNLFTLKPAERVYEGTGNAQRASFDNGPVTCSVQDSDTSEHLDQI